MTSLFLAKLKQTQFILQKTFVLTHPLLVDLECRRKISIKVKILNHIIYFLNIY